MQRLQELVRLHRLGTGARECARLLAMSPNTERTYRRALDAAGLLEGAPTSLPALETLKAAVQAKRPPPQPSAHEVSSIEDWVGRVKALWEKGLTARPIYDRLRQAESAFKGSYWAVKRLCRRLKAVRGVRASDVAIPVETAPGEVAQVDFGYVGQLLCPRTHVLRRAWVFVMVLGYSRHLYAEVVFDQKVETWLALHQRAFEWFGGVPETVVPDNLKAAVIRAAFAVVRDSALHRSYRELARHYGFKVDPTPPYAPRKKGKVESAVKYVKRNALAGRHGEDIALVNPALLRWCEEVAGDRTHGTTGRAPRDVFRREEQSALRELPARRYEPTLWKQATVHGDTHICFDGRLYSVPWRWVGKQVWVQATLATVAIFDDDERIATHRRGGPGKRSTIESHLPEHRRDLRHRSFTYWRERAARIGPQTAALVNEVFASDEVLSQLRKVQAIVTHLEGFPRERAEAASRRARFYGVYSYQGVKSILAKALDFEPLPEVPVRSKPDTPPRFARSVAEILASHVLLLGPSGVGKSHIAQALGQRACRHGHKVLYVTAHDMFKQLRAARGDDSHDRKLLRFTEPALLILDDLGLRSLEPHETLDLYDVIRLRYERGSIIVTSNRAVEELPAIFGDPLLSSAAMDRLLDDAHVLVLEGHSYRNPPQNKRNSRRTKEAA